MFAAEIRHKRVDHMRAYTQWRWHLDEVFVKINGEMHYLCPFPQQRSFWRSPKSQDQTSAPRTLSQDTEANGFRNRIVSVEGKTYSDVETLRADLAKKPADAQIEFITTEYSFAAAFLRRYRYFKLPRGELNIISVQ